MPEHKGIRLSVISQWELRVLPEFPHPDSSQFTYRSPIVNGPQDGGTFPSVASTASDSKADRLLGRQSSVSVYIPSLSGTRFWIRYSILYEASEEAPWFYFRLLMNGRPVTSWGTNTKTKPDGQVMRALFEPSDRWNRKEDGVLYKSLGTEARPFFFNNEVKGRAAAEDGGLIEVQVFRCKGRQRRIAKIEEFRPQDKYGIVMPSGGLLDQSEKNEYKFYDWLLIDPTDNPFASFKFHYRSWDSLVSLQLIPADHSRTLLPPSPSLLRLNGASKELYECLQNGEEILNSEGDLDASPSSISAGSSQGSPTIRRKSSPRSPSVKLFASPPLRHKSSPRSPESSLSLRELRDSSSSNQSTTPWLTDVFDEVLGTSDNWDMRRAFNAASKDTKEYPQAKTSYKIPTSKFSESYRNADPPSPGSWSPKIKERPLPEVPARLPVRTSSLSNSRTSSEGSGVPSIIPSLLRYLENERHSTSPEPVLGVAAAIPLSFRNSGLGTETIESIEESLSSDEELLQKEQYTGLDEVVSEEENLVQQEGGLALDEPTLTTETTDHPYEVAKRRQGMASPPPPLNSFFSLQNITLRKQRGSFKKLPKLITSPLLKPRQFTIRSATDDAEDSESQDHTNTGSVSLTESEWMCRTPSPVKNSPKPRRLSGLWSPGGRKVEAGLEKSASLRKRTRNWLDARTSAQSKVENDNIALDKTAPDGAENGSGNWI